MLFLVLSLVRSQIMVVWQVRAWGTHPRVGILFFFFFLFFVLFLSFYLFLSFQSQSFASDAYFGKFIGMAYVYYFVIFWGSLWLEGCYLLGSLILVLFVETPKTEVK